LEKLFLQGTYEFEEERHMPYVTSAERFGREVGLEEGLQKGLVEGIEVALRLRFGPDGLPLLSEIRQIRDVELLRTIHRAIETAATPDALRQVWS
jgi:hypothetical protein